MSNSNESQDKSVFVKAKITEKIARDFRVALALNNENGQDVLARAVLEYIKSTKMPADLSVGKD